LAFTRQTIRLDQHASRFRSSASLYVLFLIFTLSIVHPMPSYLPDYTAGVHFDSYNSHVVRGVPHCPARNSVVFNSHRLDLYLRIRPIWPVSAISYLIYISLFHYISISCIYNANTTEVIPSRTSRVTGHQDSAQLFVCLQTICTRPIST
jgi:hypothetical protein